MKRVSFFLLLITICITQNSCSKFEELWNEAFDFSGVFTTEDGWFVELDGTSEGVITAKGSPRNALFQIGAKYMQGMKRTRYNEFTGTVRDLDGSMESDIKVTMDDYGLKFTTSSSTQEWIKLSVLGTGGTGGTGSTGGTGGTGGTTGGAVSTLLSKTDLEGAIDSKQTFSFSVPTGVKSMEITLIGPGTYDRQLADMFVRKGSAPVITRAHYANKGWTADCASYEPNMDDERCVFTNPSSGTWYVTVFGYHAYYGADLTVKITK